MDRNRRFNFKLLVPPRVNTGPISTVKAQEIDSGGFMNTVDKGNNKCFDKPSIPYSNTSMVMPSKSTRPDAPEMGVVSPLEKVEMNGKPGHLYSKLFDEVDKIKCWKVKVDSEAAQKERKLQENKRTIETQRRAIQDLQFGNESLSMKLEEQISENEELKNAKNATLSLCNILKDTFQRTADKIHLFESEREESHQLFEENSESIQRMISAFESLRVQAESERLEMQKVKDALLHFEDLKEKFEQEYNMKQKEVDSLQAKLMDKENEARHILLSLQEIQKNYKELQGEARKKDVLLQSSRNEQESILQKLQSTEQLCKEKEETNEAIAAALKDSKEECAQMILNKDSALEELNKVKDQQATQLMDSQITVQELQNSLSLEMQRAKELELNLSVINNDLKKKSTVLGEIIEQKEKKDDQIKILRDELNIKSKSIDSLKRNIDVLETRVEEIMAELAEKNEKALLIKNELEVVSAENHLLMEASKEAERKHNDLEEKAKITEIKLLESDDQVEQLKRDVMQHEVKYEELLSNFNKQQIDKNAIEKKVESGSVEAKTLETYLKASEEQGIELKREMKRLEEENQCLRKEVTSLNTRIQEQCKHSENLQKNIDESHGDFQQKLQKKEEHIKAVEKKLDILKTRFEAKAKAQEESQKENKTFKKRITKEIEKTNQLENTIISLKDELANLTRTNQEEFKKLLDDLDSKSTFAAQLQEEVHSVKLKAAEAIKNKEDVEVKCNTKIADMVALMEKHKNQYDRMVEEKDAELNEKKRILVQADAKRTSLELELSCEKTQNRHLNIQLEKEIKEKELIGKEVNELKKEMLSMKTSQQSEATNKELHESNFDEVRSSETPKEISVNRKVFEISKTKSREQRCTTPKNNENKPEMSKTPIWGTGYKVVATPINKKIEDGNIQTLNSSATNRATATTKIKSYRIRTPPSTEKSTPWGKTTLDLDPASDSSEQNDLLTLADVPKPSPFAPQHKMNTSRKIQSPAVHKSPGNVLKLVAMKRMRDAGWTAVTASDKKKKKNTDKIFF